MREKLKTPPSYLLLFNQSNKNFDKNENQVNFDEKRSGATGTVAYARDFGTGNLLAAKKTTNPQDIENAKNKLKILRKLEGGPFVMSLFDFGFGLDENDQSIFFQLMQYATFGDGEVLQKKLRVYNDSDLIITNPLLKIKLIVEGLSCLLTAIEFIHRNHIFHGDIKTKNIFIDSNGDWYLGDFDCAEEFDNPLLSYKYIQGDKNYFSPERLNCCLNYDPKYGKNAKYRVPANFDPIKADLWGVGVAILEILTGQTFMMFRSSHPGLDWEPLKTSQDFKQFTDDNFLERLDSFTFLRNPRLDSIGYLIKRLLEIDPLKRASLEEILKLPLMNNPEYRFKSREEKKKTYDELKNRIILESTTVIKINDIVLDDNNSKVEIDEPMAEISAYTHRSLM